MTITDLPLGVDLTDPATHADGIPHELFARLRREAPVVWHPTGGGARSGFWSLTRHADVVAANRDSEHLSTAAAGTMIFDRPELVADPDAPRILIEMDPPQHTRYRLLVNRGFTPRMTAKLEGFMRAVTTRTLDRLGDRHEVDFVEDVAAELPIQVIAQLLGVTEEDRPHLFELSNRIIGFDEPEYGGDGNPATDALAEIYGCAHKVQSEKRAILDAGGTTDDIVSVLIEAEVDGERLSQMELDLFFMLLVTAGNETTRTAIAQGMLAFAEHPEQWDRLRGDRSLLPTAVEEILRWSTPIFYFRRTAVADTEIGGAAVRAGDRVVFWYSSANFDDEVFDEPLCFDVGRRPNEHVTFGGGGPHFCLGANLARLEIKVMFEHLLDRFERVELTAPPERLWSNFTHGIKRMPVRWA